MSSINLDNEDFRNHLYNQAKDGKRLWIYPGRIIGPWYRYRTWVANALLLSLFTLPWLERKGAPLFLFDVLQRKFIFFGVPFFPQDFHLVALGLLSFLIFVSLFTVLFGRIWCGWACPQTIFMEMLFRKIEYWIEGDDKAQRRLDAAPWEWEKIWKKTSKHGLFLILSFAIANTFLMYLIGKKAWLALIQENPLDHLLGLALIFLFTGVFYFVFARFREMVCMVVCPYGRLQGVLLDNKSIGVQYDYPRAEPRGKWQKHPNSTAGDCIDCHWCVRVCPTGIDIRNGANQLECIGCTACMDACDAVMEKIQKPKGLIRYDSNVGIQKGAPWRFNRRVGAYSLVLLGLIGFLGYLLWTRSPWESTLLRSPGLTYQIDEAKQEIRNLYQLELINKSLEDEELQIRVSPPYRLDWVGKAPKRLPQGQLLKASFFLSIESTSGSSIKKGPSKPLEQPILWIRNAQGLEERLETRFITPYE